LHAHRKKSRGRGQAATAGAALLVLLAACQQDAERPVQNEQPLPVADPVCEGDSYLSAALFGSIEREIRWSASDLRCESMLRPDGKGVRLRFTGEAAGSQLAIILALPELERGATAVESPTVITLTVEGSGRFFSTPSSKSCWSDIAAQEPVIGAPDRYTLSGTTFCVAPLGEINGEAAISIPEMSYRGVVDWSGP
jgi:hypothetical protein